jgi:hypothetical protein
VSGATGQSIDACEQALLGLNYPALREALSRHLSEVSRQEASHGVGVGCRKFLVITDSVDPAPRRSWSPKRASFLANCQHNICR